MDILIVLYRTILFYFVIAIVYRFMGKREIGELSIMDLIVSILIAELAAMAIDKYKSNVFISLVPICALVIIQIITAKISLKSPDIREKIEGEPSIIINRGKVNFEEMLNQRYNLDDLETSGKLSVFLKDKDHSYPLPVILDGKVDKETLVQIGKDEEWLNKRLKDNNVTAKQVFYAFYKNKHLFFIENENVK